MKRGRNRFYGGVLAMLILLPALNVPAVPTAKSPLDEFAMCLAKHNAAMYGSFLCPHCQDQKKLFGPSFIYVRYVECSLAGSREMSNVCKAAQIQHVPTWIFEGGERRIGVTPLRELSDRTGCKLP